MFGIDWNADAAVVGRIALAMLFGGVVGIDREMAKKPAGLRTHMLVAGAAALLVSLGELLVTGFEGEAGSALRVDPTRIIEAVVTGVSFLGAGTIIRGAGGQVEGLTTAASLLMAAAAGIGVAMGEWLLAAGVTGLVLLTLWGVRRLEGHLPHADEAKAGD